VRVNGRVVEVTDHGSLCGVFLLRFPTDALPFRLQKRRLGKIGTPSCKTCEGNNKATWKRGFKIPSREAGPPNHHNDKVGYNQ